DQQVKQWIREAADYIRESFTKDLSIGSKDGPDDLVTNIDQNTEQLFINHIHASYPEHYILGEEGHGHDLDSLAGVVWIIDPIDGTMNFVHQKRHFAISIGVFENGVGRLGYIYDVVADELYHCIQGQGAYVNDQLLEKRYPVALNE